MNPLPSEQEHPMTFPNITQSPSPEGISSTSDISPYSLTCHEMSPQGSFYPNSNQRPRANSSVRTSVRFPQSQYPSPVESNSSRGSRSRDVEMGYHLRAQSSSRREGNRHVSTLAPDGIAIDSMEYRPLLTPSVDGPIIHFSLIRATARESGYAFDMRFLPRGSVPRDEFDSIGDLWVTSDRPVHVRIISRDFPWVIDIKADEAPIGGDRGVTCADVWNHLYNALQEPIDDSDWAHLGEIAARDANGTAQRRQEYLVNVARHQVSRGEAVSLIRLDWLMRKTIFVGVERDEGYSLSARRLLPGRERCSETWIAYFEEHA